MSEHVPPSASAANTSDSKSRLKTMWNAGRSPKAYLIAGIVVALVGGLLLALDVAGSFVFFGVAAAMLFNSGRYWWSAKNDLNTKR